MGVVFITLGDDAPPLAERLAGIAPHLAEFDMEAFSAAGPILEPQTWNANWKLILENGMESYHLFKVHERTLEKVTPTRGAYYIEGSAEWTLTGGAILQGGGGFASKLLNRLAGGDWGGDHYTLVSIPPSFVGVVNHDSWDWITVHPLSPTSTRVWQGGLTKAPLDRISRWVAQRYSFLFLEEDQAICERAQAGMDAACSAGGQLVPMERVVVDFHNYLAWRLAGRQPPAPYREQRA